MEPVPEPEPAPGRTAVRSAAVMGKLTIGAGKFTNGYFPVPRSLLRNAAGEPIPDAPGRIPTT